MGTVRRKLPINDKCQRKVEDQWYPQQPPRHAKSTKTTWKPRKLRRSARTRSRPIPAPLFGLLPQEIYDDIATYLEAPDLCALYMVSRKLRYSFTASRWHTVTFSGFRPRQMSQSIQTFIVTGTVSAYQQYIRAAKFCPGLEDEGASSDSHNDFNLPAWIYIALSMLKNLRHLTLDLAIFGSGNDKLSDIETLGELILPSRARFKEFRFPHWNEYMHLRSLRIVVPSFWRSSSLTKAINFLCWAICFRSCQLEVLDHGSDDFVPISQNFHLTNKSPLKRLQASYKWNGQAVLAPMKFVQTISEHHRHLEWLHIGEYHDYTKERASWKRRTRAFYNAAQLPGAMTEFANIVKNMTRLRRLMFNLDEGTVCALANRVIKGRRERLKDSLECITEQLATTAPQLTHVSISSIGPHYVAWTVAVRSGAAGSLRMQTFEGERRDENGNLHPPPDRSGWPWNRLID
ncbi:hypothetical protein QBC43DRAFT_283597 [Cladorrhinum sp. PSN259]|nr:hypothetical protein QBC43DRAFT_283597 [Cladorrhinum sp. PSN259]